MAVHFSHSNSRSLWPMECQSIGVFQFVQRSNITWLWEKWTAIQKGFQSLRGNFIFNDYCYNFIQKLLTLPGHLSSPSIFSGVCVSQSFLKNFYIVFCKPFFVCFSFLAHLAKGNVSFCHHLASVVCHPLTFHILIFSSETPQPNILKPGPSIYASYQVSVHLAKQFKRRF
jgi:hypothetical protein